MVTKQDLLNGLVRYWNLDETSGSVFVDEISEEEITTTNTGMIGGTGKINNGMDLTSDWIGSTEDVLDVDGGSNTISLWVHPTSTSGEQIVVMSRKTIYQDRLYLTLSSDNLGLKIGDDNTHINMIDLNQDTWYHVVISIDNNNYWFYVNGELKKTDSYSSSTSSYNNPLKFGAYKTEIHSTSSFFTGYIDEVAIYDRAISSDEVSTLYDIQKDGYEDGSYPFDALDINFKIKGTAKKDNLLIEGAKVSCINQNTGELVGHTTSDENGEWEFSELDEEAKYHVVASLEDGEDKFNHLSFYDLVPKEDE